MSKKKSSASLARETLALFWGSVRRYPQFLWPLLVVLPLTIILSSFVRPYVVAQVLNRLSSGQYDPTNLWGSFATEILIFVAAAVGSGIVGWRIVMWLNWNLELNVIRDIMNRIFAHLMSMSARFHSNRFGGSLVSQTNKLAGSYVRFADSTTFGLIGLVISLLATIVILAPQAPLFVAILVVLSVAYIAVTLYYSRAVREANTAEAGLQSKQTGYLADAITNIFAVKTFSAGAYERERFAGVTREVEAAGRRSMYATMKRQHYGAIFTQALIITSLLIAVLGAGTLGADIGLIFLIVTYTGIIAEQLWHFQNILRQYNRSFGDATDMIEILRIKPGIKDPRRPEPLRVGRGAIHFHHMTFAHPESDEALFQNFNLKIKAGEKVGLVGHSGSGKTTLTRLLLRFSDLDDGAILIDSQDITKITQDDLRSTISYVPQEPLLFHRSLRENIAYGRPDAPAEEIARAAKRAHAAEFIERLPHRYDTLVGERGIKLSGGQRQRIAIARAMLKDAPILLLDEATSALDSESERLIQDALWKLMEGRTAIVIAHRLSTIQRMDRIVVLDNGTIVEQGSHAELLAAGGTYAKLWNHQSGGFIDETADSGEVIRPVN